MEGVAAMDGYSGIGRARREVKGRETAEASLVGIGTLAVVGGLLKLRSWTRVFMVGGGGREGGGVELNLGIEGVRRVESSVGDMGVGLGLGGGFWDGTVN